MRAFCNIAWWALLVSAVVGRDQEARARARRDDRRCRAASRSPRSVSAASTRRSCRSLCRPHMLSSPIVKSAASIPTRLGPYEVGAKIGGGGMATVYVGRARRGDGAEEIVALKVIRDELAHDESSSRCSSTRRRSSRGSRTRTSSSRSNTASTASTASSRWSSSSGARCSTCSSARDGEGRAHAARPRGVRRRARRRGARLRARARRRDGRAAERHPPRREPDATSSSRTRAR